MSRAPTRTTPPADLGALLDPATGPESWSRLVAASGPELPEHLHVDLTAADPNAESSAELTLGLAGAPWDSLELHYESLDDLTYTYRGRTQQTPAGGVRIDGTWVSIASPPGAAGDYLRTAIVESRTRSRPVARACLILELRRLAQLALAAATTPAARDAEAQRAQEALASTQHLLRLL